MEINLNSEEIFKINDTVIENVEYVKYLGFRIDKKFNFNEQIFKKNNKQNFQAAR